MKPFAFTVLSRIGSLLLVLFVTSFIVFAGMHLAPGSTESFLARGNNVTAETLAALRAQYHLDDPFLVQYFRWVGGVTQGDFGQSLQFRQPVADLLASRLPTTLWLVAYSAILILGGGVLLGVLAAVKRGGIDATAVIMSTVSMAAPSFVVAMALTSLFAVTLGIFPAFGPGGDGVLDRIWHLTLPAIALALSSTALVMRTTRTSMIATLNKEYVETARVRGFGPQRVIWRHAFRGAIVPVVTLTGLVISGLLVTTTIVETIFGLNGIGSLLVQAVNVKDMPVVQAIVLVIVTVFVLSNLIVDLLYPKLEPRARMRAGS
ncbi:MULTISPECIES: ABC transporter permease [unclassified Leucobacter]|uniref:ABC transporter permease n=1 Tax=unclassified Leucobacter TaxID=2621730 RepID=UPI00165E0314|nr:MULTISPECIES: ABC transporter permease [unclassified Leucobacter]MBC9936535.1 ABC transporter permease [Leucobacter sp. cx-87]